MVKDAFDLDGVGANNVGAQIEHHGIVVQACPRHVGSAAAERCVHCRLGGLVQAFRQLRARLTGHALLTDLVELRDELRAEIAKATHQPDPMEGAATIMTYPADPEPRPVAPASGPSCGKALRDGTANVCGRPTGHADECKSVADMLRAAGLEGLAEQQVASALLSAEAEATPVKPPGVSGYDGEPFNSFALRDIGHRFRSGDTERLHSDAMWLLDAIERRHAADQMAANGGGLWQMLAAGNEAIAGLAEAERELAEWKDGLGVWQKRAVKAEADLAEAKAEVERVSKMLSHAEVRARSELAEAGAKVERVRAQMAALWNHVPANAAVRVRCTMRACGRRCLLLARHDGDCVWGF